MSACLHPLTIISFKGTLTLTRGQEYVIQMQWERGVCMCICVGQVGSFPALAFAQASNTIRKCISYFSEVSRTRVSDAAATTTTTTDSLELLCKKQGLGICHLELLKEIPFFGVERVRGIMMRGNKTESL